MSATRQCGKMRNGCEPDHRPRSWPPPATPPSQSCGYAASPAPPQAAAGPHGTRPGPSQLSISHTENDHSPVYRAEQQLTRDCMRQHGFEYWTVPFGGQAPNSQESAYFISSVTWARKNGFGSNPPTQVSVPDPNRHYYEHLSPQRQAAYSIAIFGLGPDSPHVQVVIPQGGTVGHSEAGCQAAAEAKLYGNFNAWFRAYTIMDNLKPVWQSQVMNDAMYKRGLTGWARCMRAKGYTWASPAQAVAAFQSRRQPEQDPTEIRAAVAAAKCAASGGLAATVDHLNTFFSNTLRNKYRSEVFAYRRLQLEAIPVAQAITRSAQQ